MLRLFDAFAWVLRRAGVDYPKFRVLLGVKLTLDGRRAFTAFHRQGGRASRHGFVSALLVNAFLGFVVAPLIAVGPTLLTTMTLVHAFVMFMVALSLIADFSSVLMDTTDTQILHPRPIDGRTILAARLAHITTYITLLTLSLTGASFIVGIVKFGPAFAGIFALTLAAAVCLVVGAVSVMYLLAMRWTSGERLRDVILYCQMAMTIAVVCAYQILPRLMTFQLVGRWDVADRWWVYLVPPAWLAAPFELMTGIVDPPRIVLTALGLVVPVAILVSALRLAPTFKEALARLDAAPAKAPRADRPPRRSRGALGAWLTRDSVERASFDLVWALCGRDRQFKLRAYPGVAFVLVMAAAFLFSQGGSVREALEELPSSHKHLFLLYVSCTLASVAMLQLRYSDRHEAAWIYRALPLETPGAVLSAGLKAVIVRVTVPSLVLVAFVVLAVWGLTAVPDILLALAATFLVCGLYALLIGKCLPFSEPISAIQGAGQFSRSLLLFVPPLALGALHYGLTHIPHAVLIATPLYALAACLAFRAYARTPWRTILADEPTTTPPPARRDAPPELPPPQPPPLARKIGQ